MGDIMLRCISKESKTYLFSNPIPTFGEARIKVGEAIIVNFSDYSVMSIRHISYFTQSMFNILKECSKCQWEKVEPSIFYSEYVHQSSEICSSSREVEVYPIVVSKAYTNIPVEFKALAEKLVNALVDKLKKYIEQRGEVSARFSFGYDVLSGYTVYLDAKEADASFHAVLASARVEPEARDVAIEIIGTPREVHDGPDWDLSGDLVFAPVDPRLPVLVHVKSVAPHCGPDGYAVLSDRFKVLINGKLVAEAGYRRYRY